MTVSSFADERGMCITHNVGRGHAGRVAVSRSTFEFQWTGSKHDYRPLQRYTSVLSIEKVNPEITKLLKVVQIKDTLT